MASPEAKLLDGDHRSITISAPGTVSCGEILKLGDDRVGVANPGLNASLIASGSPLNVVVGGPIRVPAASGKTCSAGDLIYWDVSANTALPAADGSLAAGDPVIGTAIKAKTSGQLFFDVDLNAQEGAVSS